MANVTLTETMHAGEFVYSLANGDRSKENAIMVTGQGAIVPAGTVIGKQLTGTAAIAAAAGNTGNGVLGAVTVSSPAKQGVYHGAFVGAVANLGNFELFDPNGVFVGTGIVGTVFAKGGLSFTIADGGTDWVVGDAFLITVTATAIKITPCVATATDGSQIAAGILWGNTDARTADAKCAIVARDAEVNGAEISFGAMTSGQILVATEQLASLGIIVRPAI